MSRDPLTDFPHVLREYSLLADGERGAVVSPRGEIAWMCFPAWEDEAILASLIGGGGSYAVTPTARNVWGGQYEPGSLIWSARWVTQEGILQSREALAMPGERRTATLLRRIRCSSGATGVRIRLELSGEYGTRRATAVHLGDDGVWRGHVGNRRFALSGAADADCERGVIETELKLGEGEQHDLVLDLAIDDEATASDADRAWDATEAAWAAAVPDFPNNAGPRDSHHAYAVMSGLTSSAGGMVAAATTSLPERAGAGRNYDYRYAWIRDQCIAGHAAARSGALELMDTATNFVGERLREDGSKLRPAYTASGGSVPEQSQLDLPGYPGGWDLIGNQVTHQFQLDAFGEALVLFATAASHERLDSDHWRAIEIAVDAIAESHEEPDAGIWEIEPRRWTHSRLICSAGIRAVSALPEARRRRAQWMPLAERLLADASQQSLHPSGRWQRAPDDERLDVALLLPGLRGAYEVSDPRNLATLDAILSELTADGYAYRFRHDARPLSEAEGSFLLCGFVIAMTLYGVGRELEAMRWFERTRAACGPPGLLSEEYDVNQRQMRGNLPQAFVHAALLEAGAVLEPEAGTLSGADASTPPG